jgi:hypothetical protein
MYRQNEQRNQYRWWAMEDFNTSEVKVLAGNLIRLAERRATDVEVHYLGKRVFTATQDELDDLPF